MKTNITPSMRTLLIKLLGRGDSYIRGPEVNAARRLSAIGAVQLIDDGECRAAPRERWSAVVTDAEYARDLLAWWDGR